MNTVLKHIVTRTYKPLLVKYLSKTRVYRYEDIRLEISPQVFHPGFFFSTKILLHHLGGMPITGKKFLELGAGSGLISIKAAKMGAKVTATDINPIATAYLEKNSISNNVSFSIIESDLFSGIAKQVFDMIVINPPYYFEKPTTPGEHAWFCGPKGEYFRGLFQDLSNYITPNSVILMILCEGSKRAVIQSMANELGFEFECIKIVRNIIERNYIYHIHLIPGWQPVISEKKDEKGIII